VSPSSWFARPELLWLAALAIPLTALHLRHRRRTRVIVASLLLYEAGGAGQALPRGAGRRLQDLPGLLLELTALVALTLAAAGPAPARAAPPHRPVAIVLDGSASTMALRSANAAPGDTRFRRQVERALALLDTLPPSVPVSVLLAREEVRVLATAAESREAVRIALTRARPAIVGDTTLGEAVDAAAAGGAEVVVFTDGCDGTVPPERDGLHVVVVDGDGANEGIVSLSVERPAGRDAVAVATLLRKDGSVEALRVVPGATPWRHDPPGILACDDDIPAIAPLAPLSVVVVAPDARAPAHVLAALEAAAPVVDPARARVTDPATAPSLAPPDAWILDGESGGPAGPALVLDAGSGEVLTTPPVTPGASGHPVMTGVQTEELLVARARTLRAEVGDVVLLDGPAGPLALAGMRGGFRRVLLGFRPEESTLPLGGAWPVLVRRALDWVASGSRSSTPVFAAAGSWIDLELPAGAGWVRRRVPAAEEGGDGTVTIEVPGGTVRLHALLLDERESRLVRHRPAAESLPDLQRTASTPPSRPWDRDLAVLAAAALVAEWWHHRRRSSRADSFSASRGGA
jgi:hypothetical protein